MFFSSGASNPTFLYVFRKENENKYQIKMESIKLVHEQCRVCLRSVKPKKLLPLFKNDANAERIFLISGVKV